jgi:hypothetical protein
MSAIATAAIINKIIAGHVQYKAGIGANVRWPPLKQGSLANA